jgi:hypothetical protein
MGTAEPNISLGYRYPRQHDKAKKKYNFVFEHETPLAEIKLK